MEIYTFFYTILRHAFLQSGSGGKPKGLDEILLLLLAINQSYLLDSQTYSYTADRHKDSYGYIILSPDENYF